ncbi:MAG: WG repeat-containing protein [Haliscomenobacter sp.]|nr:WG repeat-containing protein [Haliscomenobacter sp.]
MDKTGKLLLPKFYKYLGFVSEGMVAFQADSLAGFMTPLGQALIKPAFHFAKEFKGGLAPVMDAKGLWGYTDKTGKVVIPFQFNGAEPFEGQLARVTQKQSASQSLWGLVDRKGTIQAPITYKSLFAANDQGIRVASTLEYNEILLNAQGSP